jgi:hypothetical protein
MNATAGTYRPETYRSAKIAGRDAIREGNRLTVFQDGMILAELTVAEDTTPGAVWALVNADYSADETEQGYTDSELYMTEDEVEAFEEAAYLGYISYELSMTDGYYTPLGRDHFRKFFGGHNLDLHRNDMSSANKALFGKYLATITP